MKYNLIFLTALFISGLLGCSQSIPKTLGDPENAVSFGYQPIDPLPVKIAVDTGQSNIVFLSDKVRVTNKRIMANLPDETMRLAIAQVDGKGNVSFTSAKTGYAGSSYLVVLDYIKFDTQSLPVELARDSAKNIIDFRPILDYSAKAEAVIPVYVGVGLRFTASIKVNEGNVDLGNLFAVGVAAEAKKITGTLVIQTLGISGKDISTLIPMPSELNTTTVQNAMMSLASIKAKIYEDETVLNPRVIGFYNNLGGGTGTVHKFITGVLSTGREFVIK